MAERSLSFFVRPQDDRRRNLVVPVVFTTTAERLDERIENSHCSASLIWPNCGNDTHSIFSSIG